MMGTAEVIRSKVAGLPARTLAEAARQIDPRGSEEARIVWSMMMAELNRRGRQDVTDPIFARVMAAGQAGGA